MSWVIVFIAIALGGLVMVVCFGIWLWRKSRALLDEVGGLMHRADELVGLLSQIEVPLDHDVPPRFPRPSDHDEAEIDDVETDLSRQRAT